MLFRSSLITTITINIIPVNDKPVVIASGNVVYLENAQPVVIDPGITVSDVDDSILNSATIKIDQLVSGDLLGFIPRYGINGNFDSQTGTLNLSGNATTAQYQEVLRSVTFFSSNENPTLGGARPTRSVSWVVSDIRSEEHTSELQSH